MQNRTKLDETRRVNKNLAKTPRREQASVQALSLFRCIFVRGLISGAKMLGIIFRGALTRTVKTIPKKVGNFVRDIFDHFLKHRRLHLKMNSYKLGTNSICVYSILV